MIQVNTETNWKIWAGVGAVGFVLVYLATFSAGKLVQKTNPDGTVSYSYEMPRVEREEAPFDLSNRQVERTVIGSLESGIDSAGLAPVTQRPLAKKVESKKISLTAAQAKAVAAKKAADLEAKKKVDLAKAEATKKLVIKQQAEARRKKFELMVLEANQRRLQKLNSEASANTSETTVVASAGFGQPATPAETKADDTQKEDESLNLSSAQWRALLQVQPTAANVAKLVKALELKKIEASSFYQITKELLMDSASDRRKAGLLLLSSVPTVATYTFMVSQNHEMSAEVQTEIKKEIAKYSEPKLLGVTSRVVASSKDPAVISSAMGNLSTAIDNFKKQPAPGTISSQGTTSKSGLITTGQLSQFLTGLTTVSQTDDPALAAQAKNLTQAIQDLKK